MSSKLFKKKNDSAVYSDWSGFLGQYGVNESSTDWRAQEKFEFLAEMAHNQAMLENGDSAQLFESTTPGLFFQKPGSVSAMGNAVAPTPGQTPFVNGVKQMSSNSGSGDKFPSLLPISIQAAAKTIAFDLVSTINMDSPVGFIPYLDYVYQGGNIDTEFAPFLIKLTAFDATSIATTPASPAVTLGTFQVGQKFIVYNSGSVDQLELQLVGYTRVDGSAVFRVIDMSSATVIAAFTAGGSLVAVTAGSTPSAVATFALTANNLSVDLTSALENQISGFTTSPTSGNDTWSGNYLPDMNNGKMGLPDSMTRADGEKAQFRQMGIRMFTKFVEAHTDQIGLSATVEQIQDFNRVWNLDIISMLEQIGVNEIAQTMSKKISAKLYELGYLHNAEIAKVEGAGLTELSLAAGGGFENTSTLQRRVVTKLAEMSNLVYHRSRWGAGEYVVTNGRVAAALADINGYTFAPFSGKAPSSGGQLYPAGEVYGMKVFVDPNMKWGDNKILIGRRGKDEEPGVKFLPYIMAETIQTISESNGSPKLFIKSRYEITEAGWHPETQYILLTVDGINKIVGSAPAVA